MGSFSSSRSPVEGEAIISATHVRERILDPATMPLASFALGSRWNALPFGSRLNVDALPFGSRLNVDALPCGSRLNVDALPCGSRLNAAHRITCLSTSLPLSSSATLLVFPLPTFSLSHFPTVLLHCVPPARISWRNSTGLSEPAAWANRARASCQSRPVIS